MEKEYMEKEESLNKNSYKLMLVLLKYMPMVCAAGYALNSLLSYFNIDLTFIGYIVHVSLIPLLYIYITSIVFKFCIYHKAFIYYIAVNELLNIVDYNWGIPVSDKGLFILNIVLICITLFILLYNHVKNTKKPITKGN